MDSSPGKFGTSPLDHALGGYQILPSQYFGSFGKRRLSAEQRLMAALLADAINVFRKGLTSRSGRRRMLYLDAERWITGRGTSRHAFSFETACDALEIDPVVLRRRLIAWKHSAPHESQSDARPLRVNFTPRQQRLSRGRSRPTRPRRAF